MKGKYVKGLIIGAVAGGVIGAVIEDCTCGSSGCRSVGKMGRKLMKKCGSWMMGLF